MEVERLYVVWDADGKPYVKGLRNLETETHRTGRTLESTFKVAGKAAGMAVAAGLVVGTAAIVGIGTASVKAAATFQYEMSRIKANASGTAQEMKALEDTVIDLGKATAFSAGEAAQAANELVKAGLSIQETMDALPGMLDLAAAGELNVAQAAEITANQLKVFGLEAKDAVEVADTLALAANRSTTEVTDLGMSLSMSASIAAQAGFDIQETAAALALLANNGLKGSDAGTSLKTMLMMLMAPTDQAKAVMEEYGIEIYDAAGHMKSMDLIIVELEEALSGLTEEEANHVKRTIAGQDAIRAVNILLKEGSDAYRDMTAEVSQSGAAADIAATKMDNLKGAYEELKGSIETAFIRMGSEGLGGIREIVDELTEQTNAFIDSWERMTETDAWKQGGFEVKLDLAVDTILEAAERLGSKFVDYLTEIDWGPVAHTVVDAVGEGLANATGWTVEVIADIIWDTASNKDSLLDIMKYGWLPSMAYQVGQKFGEGQSPESQGLMHTVYGWVPDPDAKTHMAEKEAEKEADALRELGEEQDRNFVRSSRQAEANRQVEESTKKRAEEEERLAEIEAELEAQQERLTKYTEQLSKAYEDMVDPGAIWEEAEGSLTSYIIQMEKALDSWANFGDNLMLLAEQFGPEFGSAVIMKAAEMGPDFVAALIGSDDPYIVHRALEGLEAYMGQSMESLATEVDAICGPYNVAMVDSITGALGGMDLTEQGRQARRSWNAGFEQGGEIFVPVTSIRGSASGSSSSWSAGSSVKSSAATPVHASGTEPVELTWGKASKQQQSGSTAVSKAADALADATEAIAEEISATEAMLEEFAERTSLAASYISRESSRYSMYEAQGAPLELLEQTLMDQIRFIEDAVMEAQAQLDAAKANHLPQDTINDLAQSLFGLKEDAADARAELEKLAMLPLEDAARKWTMAISQTQEIMSLLSYSSNASGLQAALFPSLMGQMGGSYQSSLDLMNQSSSYEDVMGYGSDALSALSSMFNAEVGMLDQGMKKATDVIYSSQSKWESAWGKRGDTIQDSYDAQLKTLEQSNNDLTEQYNEEITRVRSMQSELQSLWREQDRNARIGDLQSERANILAQGYYTEADVRRLQEIREQIDEQQKQGARDRQMEALQSKIDRLEQQRIEDAEELAQQQEAIQQQYDLQLQAHQKEWEERQDYYEQLLADAEARRQAEIDLMVSKYASMMETVRAQEAALLGEESQFTNAGYTLGQAFARGLLSSLDSVAAAAQAVAQAAADRLELHSPAKEGPLSSLDTWWQALPETLVKPMDVSNVSVPTQRGTTDVIEIHLSADTPTVTDAHLEQVAGLVEDRLDQRYENARVSWGRRR